MLDKIFDEFFVSDITDAMILGTLFEELFSHNVTLVATSNIIPNELYRNGLQRERFLPAIKLINEHTDIINVDSGVDYRLRTLEQAEIYHYPLDPQANENLRHYFKQLSGDTGKEGQSIVINNRQLETVLVSDGVTVGIGSGQPSRLDSCKIASDKAFHFVPEKIV